ncbi:MAG: toxin-antitoxin system YwqK family antitoxin [Planctomycetes bacterium]|nr:toxin-antitoxin system YwqK family antitoxin [Planctomycetota bacterium]
MRLPDLIVTCLALMFMVPAFSTCTLAAEGEQILLDEPIEEPPARIIKEETVKSQYEDGKLQIERGVALLSNELVLNHGKYTEYYHDGKKFVEGNFQRGIHSGEWQYWHPNEQLCKKIVFKDGRPNGQWETFREDGTREAKKQYLNGLRHGEWIRYFADGEQPKVKMTYNHGKIEGDRLTYFENGQKHQHIIFKNGLMDGTLTNWNEAGEKTSELTFKEGKAVGKVVRFKPTKGDN